MATTIDVDVLELWTSTVTRTPIMRPHTGLLSRKWSLSTSPAASPPSKRKAELRKSKEQMKKYMKTISKMILTMRKKTNLTRCWVLRAVKAEKDEDIYL